MGMATHCKEVNQSPQKGLPGKHGTGVGLEGVGNLVYFILAGPQGLKDFSSLIRD